MPEQLPYWRLSAFYLFYFAILGGLVPYWGPYLRSLGFEAQAIGSLIAILHVTKVIAPNVWGWIADHTQRRMAVVRLAAFLSVVCFAGVFLGEGFWWLALVMAAFSFFWNAALPQFEANTMSHLGEAAHRYSRIRVWGSLGFIVTVTVMGEAIDVLGTAILPPVLVALFAALWLASLVAPEQRNGAHEGQTERFMAVLLRPDVLGFLFACFLVKASHGPYYVFFSIYLADHGYSGMAIGLLWALGVVAEIVVFLRMHRWLPRFGPRLLMTAALLLSALRWVLIGRFVESLPVIIVAQTLHAASFGVYHAVGISMINRFFVGRNQGRGQAIYSSVTFGAGVAVGSFASGFLWSDLGAAVTFYLAGGAALLGAVFAQRSMPARA
ncbi:MFS transporter [Ectothiorhodospiraceae bacterium WFHF3C12]|nr:MFS transporter [Ectothiorhodospiraceae bacterium WFHF3C12]